MIIKAISINDFSENARLMGRFLALQARGCLVNLSIVYS